MHSWFIVKLVKSGILIGCSYLVFSLGSTRIRMKELDPKTLLEKWKDLQYVIHSEVWKVWTKLTQENVIIEKNYVCNLQGCDIELRRGILPQGEFESDMVI